MEELKRQFGEHVVHDEKMFAHISQSIDTIKDNHLAHIQASMQVFETEIAWLKWGVMLIIGGMVAVYFKT